MCLLAKLKGHDRPDENNNTTLTHFLSFFFFFFLLPVQQLLEGSLYPWP